jgi:uncharacterized coiled-coil DUF342 family protein
MSSHKLVYSRLKRKAPKVPDITCPAIDDIIRRLEQLVETTKQLNPRTLRVLINKLEKLRTANEQLRDSGVYWNQTAKDLIAKYVAKKKSF